MRPALMLLLLWTVGACAPSEPNGTASPPVTTPPTTVIAKDRLGDITVADVDRYLLGLPSHQRWSSDTTPAEHYATVARRLAIDRLLADEARLVGADQDPEFQALERRILRNAYSQHYLSQLPSATEPITEDELRAYYEENLSRFERGERREVSNIFLRFREDTDPEAVSTELAKIRQRSLAGESFEQLAREHSDSETRHDGGRLGWVPRGRFPEDFDRVVFDLEVGTPSEVVTTDDGAHLFWVTSQLEARSFAFEDVQLLIRQELIGQRVEKLLAEASEGLTPPPDSYLPDREEVVRLLRLGDPGTVLLQIGDFQLSAGQLQEQVQDQQRRQGAQQDFDLPLRVLDEVRQRELIYQHLLGQGLPDIPQEAVEQERRRRLVDHYTRRKMQAFLDRQPERIQAHYDRNVLRFASPLKVHVRHLAIPLRDDAHLVMARLEEARAQLDAGTLELGDLATNLQGRLRDLGLVTAAQLQAIDPLALRFAFQLKAGEHSPPYKLGRALVMFEVAERQEPVARPLPPVRLQVMQDYLTHESTTVFREMSDELLADAGFELYSDRLSGIGPILSEAS